MILKKDYFSTHEETNKLYNGDIEKIELKKMISDND
jgi:hypothetical protein